MVILGLGGSGGNGYVGAAGSAGGVAFVRSWLDMSAL